MMAITYDELNLTVRPHGHQPWGTTTNLPWTSDLGPGHQTWGLPLTSPGYQAQEIYAVGTKPSLSPCSLFVVSVKTIMFRQLLKVCSHVWSKYPLPTKVLIKRQFNISLAKK